MNLTSLTELKNSDSMGKSIKLGAGLIIGFAADIAVSSLLKTHIPVGKGIIKLLTKLGIFAIGMKVAEDVENYFYDFCDDTKKSWDEARKEAEAKAAEIINQVKDEGGH